MPRRLAATLLVAIGAIGLCAALAGTARPAAGDLGRWWPAVGLAEAYRPSHPVDRAALATIDFARVHEELWPAWIVAESSGEGDQAYDALRAAVTEPNLAELLEEIRWLAREPVERSDRLLERARAWNAYLDEAGLPWRIALGVQVTGGGPFVYVKTYEVLSDTRTEVGAHTYRTRVLARADGTNVVEQWLGTTRDHEEGALVILDRLAVFTLDKVWPLLDPALDPRHDPHARAFAPSIRASVEAALAPEHVAVLRETASDRFLLLRATDAVHGRHVCGSRFVIGSLPFDGLAPDDVRTLERFAAATATSPCPDVTREEAVVFGQRSAHLRSREGLRPAIEALLAWTTRAIVVHEARHAADDRTAHEGPPACNGCPAELPPVGVHELSAYLASFAHPAHGALALYQACGIEPMQVPVRAQVVSWLTTRLETGCDAPPPPDLADRARRLETEVFGRTEAIAVATEFPLALPLRR